MTSCGVVPVIKVAESMPQYFSALLHPAEPLAGVFDKSSGTKSVVYQDHGEQTLPQEISKYFFSFDAASKMSAIRAMPTVSSQTDEPELVWEEELPTVACLNCAKVETFMTPMKHRLIQCSILEVEQIHDSNGPFGREEIAVEYEEIEADERYYTFKDTLTVQTQTERLPLISWMEFTRSTGFQSEQACKEFYEALCLVRRSSWNRRVPAELAQYFTNVGYSFMDHDIYDHVMNLSLLNERSSQISNEPSQASAEIGVQFPYEIFIQEPFEYQERAESEQSVEESYEARLLMRHVSEVKCQAVPSTQDFSNQHMGQIVEEIMPKTADEDFSEITTVHESNTFRRPMSSAMVNEESQADLGFSSEELEIRRRKKLTTTSSFIEEEEEEEEHVIDEPMYMLTQVCMSTVTEAVQTEVLSYEYLQEQLRKYAEKRVTEIPCLHDLDITTYFFDEDILEEEYLRRITDSFSTTIRSQTPERMPVTLRQRVVEYELCNMMSQIDARLWNDIREVASPVTGLFAPVSFAVRQGWIQLGRRNEYIDPTTGHAIPLETALAQGRLRFASSRDAAEASEVNSSLVLIERESLSWQYAEATHVLNTATRLQVPINQARADGLIRVDENNRCWFLDVRSNIWIAGEEAVSQNILTIEEGTTIEEVEEIRKNELQQPVVHAYHVNAIRPGGEPSEWLKPEDAAQLGLFNWQTGEVAVDWPARPLISRFSEEQVMHEYLSEHVVTQWCHFLTARQAGWIRLIPEHNFNRWVPLSQPGIGNANRRLLSTAVTLISNTEESGRLHTYRFETTETRRRNIQQRYQTSTTTRQYQTFPRDAQLVSGSQSTELHTEYSGSQHLLTEVGGFEHSDVYTLPSQRQAHLELSEERTETGSIQQFARLDMHHGGMADVQVFEQPTTDEEHVGAVHSGFEEMHMYSSSQQRSQQLQYHQQERRTWGEQEQALLEGEQAIRNIREESQHTSGWIPHGETISTITRSVRGESSHVSRFVHSQQQLKSQHSYQDFSTSTSSTPTTQSHFHSHQQ